MSCFKLFCHLELWYPCSGDFCIFEASAIKMNSCTSGANSFDHTQMHLPASYTLRGKYPYSELFWSVSSHIQTEYGEIWGTSPYSLQMRENTDQNNSEFGHFLRSDSSSHDLRSFFMILASNIENIESLLARSTETIWLKEIQGSRSSLLKFIEN